MDKGPIDGVTDSGKGLAVTSPMASRRGSFVAPVLLFVALLGGALFFGVLAVSGKNQTGIATDNAAVTDPSPSKAAPAAKTIATTRPSVTATPPSTGRTGSPRATDPTGSASDRTREFVSPQHKPVPGRTVAPVEGDYCTPTGAKARSATGDHLICEVSEDITKSRWNDES
jgi:hypothetical protein